MTDIDVLFDADELEDVPVVDLDRAEWCLRQIARARRVRDEEAAVHHATIERCRLLIDAAEKRAARIEDHYADQLESFHRALLRDDPKRKTIDLPSGALKARAQQPEWTFGPEFTDWAKVELPEVLRTKVEVDRNEAKRRLFPLGDGRARFDEEIVPGVTVEVREPKFSVET